MKTVSVISDMPASSCFIVMDTAVKGAKPRCWTSRLRRSTAARLLRRASCSTPLVFEPGTLPVGVTVGILQGFLRQIARYRSVGDGSRMLRI